MGSVNSSLRYDKRIGTALSSDLPTVEEGEGGLDMTTEDDHDHDLGHGHGTPIHALRARSITPYVLQRNDPIQGYLGDQQTEEKENENELVSTKIDWT
jgi:hypothetical protein